MSWLRVSRIVLQAFVMAAEAQTVDLTGYVNIFLGTTAGGNMFPGVVPEPYSMVKFGVDVQSGTTDAYSGYLPSGNVTGFSLLHLSGTGGAPKYGVVSQLPVTGDISSPLANLAVPRFANDSGSVGYYKTQLANGVTVELAGTSHAGFYQYGFPSNQTKNVVVDVSHVLPSFRGLGWGQGYTNGTLRVEDDGHYEGSGTYYNGWNLAPNWTVYFCGRWSDKPTTWKTFRGVNTTSFTFDDSAKVSGHERVGAVFTFEQDVFSSRVGVSFISCSQACSKLDAEISEDASLTSLVQASKDAWNTKALSRLAVESENATELTQLYSSIYGMLLMPTNRTGENPASPKGSNPYYDDIFTFWDLFRCTTALQHVLQPQAYEEQIQSLVTVWQQDGFLPDARSSNFNGRTQGGSNADNVLADAFVKGVRGNVDWNQAYEAMKTDAEVVPPNNHDPSAPDASTKEGRGALPDWLQYGYITPRFTRAVSRAVEYAVNDFGLYQVAKGLGNDADAETYLNRSHNWRNHWNPNSTSLGFSGFLVPRYANGSFVKQDPTTCGGCYWGDAYYEALPWEYSFNAHHDIHTLVQYSGGQDNFVKRLDKMFETNVSNSNAQFGYTMFNPGNEPSFTTPYLYHFARRQDLSVLRSRYVAKSFYGIGTDGLPGNSDAGAMQSWVLWNMIGLYPMTGQTTFLIGSPWFSRLSISLGDDKKLDISTTGGSSDAYYVQSLKVNGQTWNQNWVTWADVFQDGGNLEFVLGSEPNTDWDTGPLPPSPAS